MLRPSVSVTRKVMLRFKRTNLKLFRELTLQGKRVIFLCPPDFKYRNHLPQLGTETPKTQSLSAIPRAWEKRELF